MKKLLALLLTMSIFTICTSCTLEPRSKETKITLTEENFEEYFNVNIYNTDFQERVTKGIFGNDYGYNCTVNIEISKATDFELSDDVCVTYFINSAWDNISGTYENENYHKCVDIKIPSSGIVNKRIQCTQSPTMVKLFDEPKVYFEKVTGTIFVKNADK